MSFDRRPTRRWTAQAVILAAAMLGSALWYFGPALFTGKCFAFRDAAHYYYPLFEWTSRRWAAGEIPLWNPQENCGVPVVADATSSVFYPGKLLFALPLGFALKYKLYVVGHILMAGLAAFKLARHWRASTPAAGLCAVSYAFGGNVLFQYCNVVYLIGAAWLPAALLAADRMLVDRRIGAALSLGLVLALMVLGGDPQMAYNAAMLVTLYAVMLWVRERKSRKQADGQDRAISPDVNRRVGGRSRIGAAIRSQRILLLTIAAMAALVLSAIQVFPSSQWTSHCQRAAFRDPRSIFEIPAYLAREDASDRGRAVARGIFGAPAPGTHHEHTYHFSVGPWRLAEFVWPNLSGRMFPVNRRWTNAIPAEGRIWTPSLYAGLLPLLLGLGAWRLRGGDGPVRLASWMVLLATLAAFGWYGFGWLLQEIRVGMLGCEAEDLLMGHPVGGLYWLMTVGLPGYALFRFPAKLMVITSLGLGLLAARGFDRLWATAPKRLRRCLLCLAAISLLALLVSFGAGTYWERLTGGAPDDALFGPYDAGGALADLRLALLHIVLVGSFAWWILGRITTDNRRWIAPALLLVTALDLAVANRWMVITAPEQLWQTPGECEAEIVRHLANPPASQPVRVLRGARASWWPKHWTEVSAGDRHVEGLRWDRETLSPKYPLLGTLEMVESFGSCTSSDYLTLLNVARRFGPLRPDKAAELHPSVSRLLGAQYLIFPGDFDYAQARKLTHVGDRTLPEDTSLWLDAEANPRVWIVHDFWVLPPLDADDPAATERRTREVLFPEGKPRDFLSTAVVESDTDVKLPHRRQADGPFEEDAPNEQCEIVSRTPERIEVRAHLANPGLLVLSETYYPGWIAEVRSSGGPAVAAPILRTNRIMRGVILPAGEHTVVFSYRPTGFYVGTAISFIGWLALLIGSAVSWCRKRRHCVTDVAQS